MAPAEVGRIIPSRGGSKFNEKPGSQFSGNQQLLYRLAPVLAKSYGKSRGGDNVDSDQSLKRTESEALKVMSDYYRGNKANWPTSIVTQRKQIVTLLMDGVSAREAFSRASRKLK